MVGKPRGQSNEKTRRARQAVMKNLMPNFIAKTVNPQQNPRDKIMVLGPIYGPFKNSEVSISLCEISCPSPRVGEKT
jgi:hypothetical protein